MSALRAIFDCLRALPTQWLTAAVLTAFAAVIVLGYVQTYVGAAVTEKTGLGLVALQFSGWSPHWPATTHSAKILAEWKEAGVLGDARRAQLVDFFFAAGYGTLALLLAGTLWRCHPLAETGGGRWTWLIALGALAAVFDEVENVSMWRLLSGHETAGWLWLLPTCAAVLKFALLGVGLATLIVALVRLAPSPESPR